MADVNESILTSVKKVVGMTDDYTPFDEPIIMAINSALGIVEQIIDVPTPGFKISDKTSKWVDFLGSNEKRFEFAKTYVCEWVVKIFDPPASTTRLQALNEDMNEMAWRLAVRNDEVNPQ